MCVRSGVATSQKLVQRTLSVHHLVFVKVKPSYDSDALGQQNNRHKTTETHTDWGQRSWQQVQVCNMTVANCKTIA